MKLVVFSHKVCWPSDASPIGYATDGGFVFHMQAMAGIFDAVNVLVPVDKPAPKGEVPFTNTKLTITPFAPVAQKGLYRKLYMPIWFFRHFRLFYTSIKHADAVHAPIPGDIGTIGMLMAHAMRKPLFVRHCGNWMVAKTAAEKFWKWYMIKYAGGNRVFYATGGSEVPPAAKNPALEWIFSSSLTKDDLTRNAERSTPGQHGELRLLIACRQDEQKGTGRVIEALKLIQESYSITFDVIGEGSDLVKFKQLAEEAGQQDRIRFWGKLSHKDVIATMKTADVFCYPTRASEGFPKVVLEAMSCGMTIIANPVSVLKTLIPDSNAGVILPNDEPANIAEIIRTLYHDRNLLVMNAKRASDFAKQFSLESWADKIREKMELTWKRKTI
jgi:glycosyltransferase involved in cell wall biosynthesis